MGLEQDFQTLQSQYNALVYHYHRLTEKKVKGEATQVRKRLSEIASTCKDMRKSTQEYKEKM